jgi:hypothetical protein
MKLFRNTAAVLVLTLFTGLAVFTAIQLGDRLFGTPDASAQTVGGQNSPATEQSTDDYNDDYYDDSEGHGGGYGYGQNADPYGQSSSTQGSTTTTQTCPATGCSASSCHATQ